MRRSNHSLRRERDGERGRETIRVLKVKKKKKQTTEKEANHPGLEPVPLAHNTSPNALTVALHGPIHGSGSTKLWRVICVKIDTYVLYICTGRSISTPVNHAVSLLYPEVGLLYHEVASFSHEVGLFYHEVAPFGHEVGLLYHEVAP